MIPAELQALIQQAAAVLGSSACRDGGHLWESIGGRQCPHPENIGEDHCSQAVYECPVCGEVDYGDRRGPGFDDCMDCRHKWRASDLDWWGLGHAQAR